MGAHVDIPQVRVVVSDVEYLLLSISGVARTLLPRTPNSADPRKSWVLFGILVDDVCVFLFTPVDLRFEHTHVRFCQVIGLVAAVPAVVD